MWGWFVGALALGLAVQAVEICPGCTDISPDDRYSCETQAKVWNKCGEPFMADACNYSCGRCSCWGGTRAQPSSSKLSGPAEPAAPDVEPTISTTHDQATHGQVSKTQPQEEAVVNDPAGSLDPDTTPSDPADQAPRSTAPAPAAAPAPAPIHAPAHVPTPTSSLKPKPAPAREPVPANAPPTKNLDNDISCNSGVSIWSLLAEDANTTLMRQALTAAGLAEQLQQGNVQITLFVPSNQAWEQLAQDSGVVLKQLVAQPDILKSVALYHVLPRALAPTQLSSQPAWQGYWAGYVLFANENRVSGEGTSADITRRVRVCNSYVYFTNYVLLPVTDVTRLPAFELATAAPPPPAKDKAGPLPCVPTDTAFYAIKNTIGLEAFTQSVQEANVTSVLNHPDKAITVLAPDNEAWRQLLATQPTATPAWLQQAVLTHVISQQLGTQQLPSGGVIVRSLAQGGKPINIGRTAGGDIQVQVFGSAGGADARVTEADVGHACNAAVHIINRALDVPAGVPAVVAASGRP